jgi:hypothetical protein
MNELKNTEKNGLFHLYPSKILQILTLMILGAEVAFDSLNNLPITSPMKFSG